MGAAAIATTILLSTLSLIWSSFYLLPIVGVLQLLQEKALSTSSHATTYSGGIWHGIRRRQNEVVDAQARRRPTLWRIWHYIRPLASIGAWAAGATAIGAVG